MYSTIKVDRREGVGIITFNRPEVYNALSLLMREEINLALEALGKDEETKVLVITGAGKGFCSGGDVKEQRAGFDAISGQERVQTLQKTLLLMVNMEKPIICAVNGIAIGAGASLAIASDMIIAADEAKFSQTFINIAFIPDFGGLYFLPRLVGLARAKELVFTGRMIDAKEAKEIGLVNQVVPRAELNTVTFELARSIAKRSAKTLAFDKILLNRSMHSDLTTMLEMEAFAQGICFQSDEHKKALSELLSSKRKK